MTSGGKRPGAGRPRHKASERLSRRLWTRVTEAEGREIDRMAAADGKALPDWIRDKLLGRNKKGPMVGGP